MDIRRMEVRGPGERTYGMAYAEWGSVGAPRTLICVHGLTRTGRDFDRLASALAGDEVLEGLITHLVLPQVADALRASGMSDPNAFLRQTLGGDRGGQSEVERHLRRQFVSQVLEPVVEYRVCPMARSPVRGARTLSSKTWATRPMSFTTVTSSPSLTAMPADSWPRCWSA